MRDFIEAGGLLILAGVLIFIVSGGLGFNMGKSSIAEMCDKRVDFMVDAKIYRCEERRP